jgi:hypothetical protein
MAGVGELLALAGYAIGAIGGVLIFIEFFMTPSYVTYKTEFGEYSISVAPSEVDEYTWAGRLAAPLIPFAFALAPSALLV